MSIGNSWAIAQTVAARPRMVGRWVGVQNFSACKISWGILPAPWDPRSPDSSWIGPALSTGRSSSLRLLPGLALSPGGLF
jgi:hypothetical protein